MIFVVGDIHGEITKLRKLLEAILHKDKNAEFVFIGDYLDKGEDVLATLIFLTDFSKKNKCIFLSGNHEYLWMNFETNDRETENYLLKYGGLETLRALNVTTVSEGKKVLLDKFPDFFGSLEYYWGNADYIAVHSGIRPEDYQKAISEIEPKNLLFNRYDFISNQSLYLDHLKVIFGHTGFFTPYADKYKVGVDTAACFRETQPLTAFCVQQEMFINSDAITHYLKTVPSDQCPNIVRQKPWRENERAI